jgi:hypothetical protein
MEAKMLTWFNGLLINPESFMPHGACYLWLPSMLWLHILSDATIALAYFSIPFALWYFVNKRTDLAYRWVFVLFDMFILLCQPDGFQIQLGPEREMVEFVLD